ncbi:MAG: replicative DNA helicase [Phycisphaeraceae bacterium]|nr:replicative DNA helicase [Phycisphaeraceae bacterium]
MTDLSNNSGAGGPQDQPPRDRKRTDDAARRQPLEKMFEKPPPHSPEAEMALLGAMILDPTIVHDVVPIIRTPEAFYIVAHVAIYDAIVRMYDQKQSGDLVLLHEELRDKEQLAGVGGAAYLQKLAEETPGPAAAEHFARIIADKYKLRRLINAGGKILYDAYNAGTAGPEGAREVVDAAETLIFEIAQQEESSAAERLNILLDREVQRLEGLQGRGVSGVATGYADLDELTSGLQQGEMIIIAARPSMGKCLAADSEIVLADGSVATIEEIYRRKHARLATLGGDLTISWTEPSDFIDDGHKPVFEVTTRLGRRIRTTLTHPFLTLDGWTPLGDLNVGDHVAVPRRLETFGSETMRECEVRLLAYLIGDGGLTGTVPRFTATNPEIVADFEQSVREFGGLRMSVSEARSHCAPSWRIIGDEAARNAERSAFAARLGSALQASGRNRAEFARAVGVSPESVVNWTRGRTAPEPGVFDRVCKVLEVRADDLAPGGLERIRKNSPNALTRMLMTHGLMGKDSGAKHIPAAILTLRRDLLALFLNRLFSTDGWATLLASGQAQLGYSTNSERLARQVQHLLLRFGVLASLRLKWVRYRDTRRPAWQIDITDSRSILSFATNIGIFGKGEAVARVVAAVSGKRVQTNRDLIPRSVWPRIAAAKGEMSWSELARRIGGALNMHVGTRALSRPRLAKIAAALGSADLAALADSDVYWDRIVSIEPLGPMQVYDLTIPGTHNFIANDVCVHNTALALCLAEQVAFGGSAQGPRDGKQVPIAFFSLEMSKSSIAQRMLSARSGLSSHDMRSGRLSEEGYRRLADAAIELEHAPIYIDDTPGLSILGLRTRARRLVAQHGVRAIFIDYLQLMSAPGSAKESRQVEVSAISRGVKALARELEVPVICLSQLNRGPEARGDNRPRMSDLRESGSIEQDADVVMLLHREAYYHVGDRDWEMDNADKLNVAEIIIAKQRNGPTDVVKLVWDAKSTRFKNYGAYPGGTGLSPGYAAPHAATGGHGAAAEPPPFDDPFRVPVVTFAPGKKAGPVGNFRDGGGPDKDDDLPV